MKKPYIVIFFIISVSTLFLIQAALGVQVRTFDHNDYSRFVIEAGTTVSYKFQKSPQALRVEIAGKVDFSPPRVSFDNSKLLESLSFENDANRSYFTLQTRSDFRIKRSFVLERPYRIVFDLVPAPLEDPRNKPPEAAVQPEREAAVPGASPQETVPPTDEEPPANPVQEKKLYQRPIEIICIDPGHGGEDFGAVGSSKTIEKDVALDISFRLKKLLEERLGLRVLMTRDKDVEVPLNNRAALANNQNAQLFVSIHVNSSFRKSASGAETYFVSLKATDEEALQLAIKENSKWQQEEEESGRSDDNLNLILWNMIQTEYIKESSKLAEFVQDELNRNLRTLNRGVKQAPFRVLMRVAMPAILVEVGFISNSEEERSLKNPAYLQKIALAIYNGINRFVAYYRSNILK